MASTKVIFLDRDGVINKDPGGWTKYSYVTRPEEFEFLPDALRAIKELTDAGYDIVIISNQAGISKGFFLLPELEDVTDVMLTEIGKKGGKIKKVYYCIHQNADGCSCRKPKPGMFKKAESDLGIRAEGKFFVGDGKFDVEAGAAYGLKTILVLSGKTSMEEIEKWSIKPDFICADLLEAARLVIQGGHS